jgi:hypothetical protein
MNQPPYLGRLAALVCILLAAIVWPVHAEVMDKEPSIADNWFATGICSFAAILAWRFRWWAGGAVAALFLITRLSVWSELHDPFVGPAIIQEAGSEYVWQFYLSAGVGLAVQVTAAAFGLRRWWRSRSLPQLP